MLRRTIAFLPFIAPFVLYGFYFLLVRRRARADGTLEPSLAEAPWMWLMIAGFALLVVSMTVFAVTDGSDIGGTYVPARLEDGKLVPGEIK